jgi:hypothetical protein
MEFYYTDPAGQAVGPVSQEHLQALLQTGTLTGHSMVAQAGAAEWQPLGVLFQIDTLDAGPPSQMSPTAQRGPAGMRRGPAAGYRSAIPSDTLAVLCRTAPWAYVTSVYWWILAVGTFSLAGLLVIGALQAGGMMPILLILALLVLVIGVLTVIPAMQCWSFASNLSDLRSQPGYLEAACRRQAAYFRTFAIYGIMFATLLGLVLIFSPTPKTDPADSAESEPSSTQLQPE